jgi:hypothetical protein
MKKMIESVTLDDQTCVFLVLRSINWGERLPFDEDPGGRFPIVEIHSVWGSKLKAEDALRVFQDRRPSAVILKVPLDKINPFENSLSLDFLSPDRFDN